LLLGLCSTTASACVVIPFASIENASDVIVEGRYFRDPADRAAGHVEPAVFERGERRGRYEIRWSMELLEDPTEGQCATQIPSDGHYGRFYLLRRDGGRFEMIGRAWAEDPKDPEGTHD
jgi:hypothetical protein